MSVRLFGLTGGIASGKSTASDMLRDLGAQVIDADAVYHDLIAPTVTGPSPLARAVQARFGDVLRADGALDRTELGRRVFGKPEELTALGEITHPAVAREVAHLVATLAERGATEVVYDVPLLYERNLDGAMEAVIVVWVSSDIQRARLMQREGIDAAETDRRIASQMPLDQKRDHADHVIDNSGSLEETRRQVEVTWAELCGPHGRAATPRRP